MCLFNRTVHLKRTFGGLTPHCLNNIKVENSNLCFIASGHSTPTYLFFIQQLRAAIAPCIESVFLLDRLCYLYEQV